MIKTPIGMTLAPFPFELLYIISSNSQSNDFPLSALSNSGLSLKPDLFFIDPITLRTAVEKGKGGTGQGNDCFHTFWSIVPSGFALSDS
jgi:hypothetical protein